VQPEVVGGIVQGMGDIDAVWKPVELPSPPNALPLSAKTANPHESVK
jgi:hypothetical protein